MTHSIDALVEQAKAAINAGNKQTARELFLTVTRINERHEAAWYLLSTVVEDVAEQVTCLENVVTINPENSEALARLETLKPLHYVLSGLSVPAVASSTQRLSFGHFTFDRESAEVDTPVSFHTAYDNFTFHEDKTQGNLLTSVAFALAQQGRFTDAQNVILEVAPAYRDQAIVMLMQSLDTSIDASAYDMLVELSQHTQSPSTRLMSLAKILLWLHELSVLDANESRIQTIFSNIIRLAPIADFWHLWRESFNESDFGSFFTFVLNQERLDVAEALLNAQGVPSNLYRDSLLELIKYHLIHQHDADPYVELLLDQVQGKAGITNSDSSPFSKTASINDEALIDWVASFGLPITYIDFDAWADKLNVSSPSSSLLPPPPSLVKSSELSDSDYDAWENGLNLPLSSGSRPFSALPPPKPGPPLPRPATLPVTKPPPKSSSVRLTTPKKPDTATAQFWQEYPVLLERVFTADTHSDLRKVVSKTPVFLTSDDINRLIVNLNSKSDASQKLQVTYLGLYLVYADALDHLLKHGHPVQQVISQTIEQARHIGENNRAHAFTRMSEIVLEHDPQQALDLLKSALAACTNDDKRFVEFTSSIINSGYTRGFYLLESWLTDTEQVSPFFRIPKLEIDFSRFLPANKFLELMDVLNNFTSKDLRNWVIQQVQAALKDGPKPQPALSRNPRSSDFDFGDDDDFDFDDESGFA
jgi:hypothetical protein